MKHYQRQHIADVHTTDHPVSVYRPLSDTDQYFFREELRRERRKQEDHQLARRLGAAIFLLLVGACTGAIGTGVFGMFFALCAIIIGAAVSIFLLLYILFRKKL